MQLEFSLIRCSKTEAEIRADKLQTDLTSLHENMEAKIASLKADKKQLQCEAEKRDSMMTEASAGVEKLEKKNRSLKKRLHKLTKAKEAAEYKCRSIIEENQTMVTKMNVVTARLTMKSTSKPSRGSGGFISLLKKREKTSDMSKSETNLCDPECSSDTTADDTNNDSDDCDASARGMLEQFNFRRKSSSRGSKD